MWLDGSRHGAQPWGLVRELGQVVLEALQGLQGMGQLEEGRPVQHLPLAHLNQRGANIRQTTEGAAAKAKPVFSKKAITDVQEIVRRVPVAEPVVNYAMSLVRKTRIDGTDGETVPDFVKEYVAWGAGPRASQYLVLAAKARAILAGRHSVAVEDIRAVALPVMRHRIVVNFHAEAQNINAQGLIARLLADIEPKA